MLFRPEITSCLVALGLVAGCAQAPTNGAYVSDAVGDILSSGPADVVNSAITVKLTDYQPSIKAAALSSSAYAGSQAAIQGAAQGVTVANSALAPQVSLQSQLGGVSEKDKTGTENTTGVSASLSVNKLIYDGGASVSGINAAFARVIAAEAQAEEAITGIVADMASAWIDLWQYQQRSALLAERSQEGRDIVQQMDRLVASGMVDKSSVASAKIQIHDLDIEEMRLSERVSDAQSRLSKYFKRDGSAVARPSQIISLPTGKNAATAWQGNPALRSTAASIVIAEQDVQIAAAQKKPSVGLRAGVDSPMSETSSTDIALGLQLSWTLGDGGRRDAELAARKANLTREKQQFDTQKRETVAMLSQMMKTRASLLSSQSSIRAKNAEVLASRDTLKKQLATGQADLKRVIDAEIQALRTADRAIEIDAEIMKLDVSIAAQSGRLLSSFGIPAPQSNITKALDK